MEAVRGQCGQKTSTSIILVQYNTRTNGIVLVLQAVHFDCNVLCTSHEYSTWFRGREAGDWAPRSNRGEISQLPPRLRDMATSTGDQNSIRRYKARLRDTLGDSRRHTGS